MRYSTGSSASSSQQYSPMLNQYANSRLTESERLYALSQGWPVESRNQRWHSVEQYGQRAGFQGHSYSAQDDMIRDLAAMSKGSSRR